jgi:excisionase family DNA binding protein
MSQLLTSPSLSDLAVRGSTTAEMLDGRLTITVPEAGQLLGIGRDASYAAAARGEIPVRRLGRRLVVPVPEFLRWLGVDPPDMATGPPVTADEPA